MTENENQNQNNSDESVREMVMRSLNKVPGSVAAEASELDTDDPKVEDSSKAPIEATETPVSETAFEADPKTEESIETEPESMTRSQAKKSNKKKKHKESVSVKETDDLQTVRGKEDKIVSRIVIVVVTALILIGGLLGFSAYRYVSDSLQPLDPSDEEYIQVNVPIGSSNKQIGSILEKEQVIKSGMIFNYYAKFNNLTDFQAGYYNFQPSMTLDEIAELLKEGGTAEPEPPVIGKVIIPEGLSIDQVAEAVEVNKIEKQDGASPFKKDDFLALMKNEEFFNKMLAAYPALLTSASQAEGVRYKLEGYLFPATFEYHEGMTVEELATEMIAAMDAVMAPYYDMIANDGMTVQQVLTLASLVEKEGVKEEDRKRIAQVFFNRLEIGMPLQSDISVLYALGEHKTLLSEEDTLVDSPYNLYQNTGYGPGPFDNPSKGAIEAVMQPTPTDDYYFVADISTGNVYFAETYEQHLELVEQYVNNQTE